MSVTIKSPQEIELMREAGKILAKVHEQLGKELKPGMSTLEVDRLGEEMIRSFGCEPSFKGYQGYPASICVSINEEVVHGIPRADRIIEEGDIVSLDAGVIYKGYQSDAARTHGVGEISDDAKLLIERTRQSFFEGIKFATAGNHLHQISAAIGDYAGSFGYGVVRDLCGDVYKRQLVGTAERPRLAVFRSNNHMYAQIIDDTVGNTLVSASTLEKDVKAELEKTNNVEAAAKLGTVIAKKALDKGINTVRCV